MAMRLRIAERVAAGPSASAPIQQEPPATAVATAPSAKPMDDQGAISVDQLPSAADKKKKASANTHGPAAPAEAPKPVAKPAAAPKPTAKPGDDPFAHRR